MQKSPFDNNDISKVEDFIKLRFLDVDEWIVSVLKTMYEDALRKVRANGRVRLSMLKWGCIRTPVLSPLLFIIG